LRRAGWVIWVLQLASLLLTIGVGLAAPASSRQSSWGAQGLIAELAYLVLTFSFPCVGMVVIQRQPRNAFGWVLLVGVGLGVAMSSLLDSWATYGLVVQPGSLSGAGLAASLNEGIWVWVIGSVGIFLILLFPDGRLPSRGWRWLPWTGAVTIIVIELSIAFTPSTLTEGPIPGMANPVGVPALEQPLFVALAVTLPLLPLCIVASALALLTRFRRSQGVERQQLKWLAAAGALVAVCYFAAMAAQLTNSSSSADADPAWITLLQNLVLASFIALPIAIGTAILRYRLYDIDIVIKRTLVYSTLTVTLVATYLLLVLVLQVLLRPLAGDSDLAVAASTLTVAALFRPLRSAIQGVVDRRFFRSRYDAARSLERFSASLRHELDLDTMSTDLRAVVRDTMQPEHVSVWLREDGS